MTQKAAIPQSGSKRVPTLSEIQKRLKAKIFGSCLPTWRACFLSNHLKLAIKEQERPRAKRRHCLLPEPEKPRLGRQSFRVIFYQITRPGAMISWRREPFLMV